MIATDQKQPGNILIAADYRAPRSGNFIASLLDLAKTLKEQGGETVFLFPAQKEDCRWPDWIREQGFPVLFLEDRKTKEEKLAFVKTIVSQYNIRLIHVHFGYLESLLVNSHKSLGVKLVIHDHFDFVTTAGQVRQRLSTMKKALRYRFRDVYCICVMQKKNRWYWPAGKKRHTFIINGLSLERAERDELSVEERRKEIGLREGEKLVLFLGWDMLRKGLDIAVKATERCRESDPGIKLGVIGVGKDGKPSEQAKRFLSDRGIDPFSGAVIYMHSYEDVFALNRAVNCYISSSRAEAFSYGILEAISQNTPVVVSDIDGTKWCWDYTNCFTYSVEDPEDCAGALKKALIQGRAPSNYEQIVSRYSSRIWCKRVLDVYHKALKVR